VTPSSSVIALNQREDWLSAALIRDEKCLDLYHKCDRGAAGNFLDLPSERFLYIDEVGDYCVQAPF
jgi:hypothetical protein